MKKSILGLMGVLSIGIFTIIQIKETSVVKEATSPLYSYKEEPKTDQPDAAMLLEIEKTVDPVLGVVPRERLAKAYKYQQELLNSPAKAAIAGVTWTERGPNNVGGRVRSIIYDKNDVTNKTVWVGSVGGGLWKTTDITAATTSWTRINDFFANLAVTSITQCVGMPNLMAFGTGEGFYNADAIRGDGVWVSKNSGLTWTQLPATISNTAFSYIQKVVLTKDGHLLVATFNDGIHRFAWNQSTSSWSTPVKVLGNGISGGTVNIAYDIEIGADGRVYAGMGGWSLPDGVYRSTDNGITWKKIYTSTSHEFRIELAPAPNDANYLYMALHSDSIGVVVKRTTNATATPVIWTNIAPGAVWKDNCQAPTTDFTRGAAWYNLICAVSPTNRDMVYVGGIDVLRSTNGGGTWTQISEWSGCNSTVEDMHADHHAMAFQPGTSTTMLFGCDGGVYRSTNVTATTPTYTHRNTGLNITQYYSCAMVATAGSNLYLAGSQDNGTSRFSTSGINAVTQASGGDGGFCHVDQNQSNFAFTSIYYNNHHRSTTGVNGAFSPVQMPTGVSSFTGRFINPTDYDNVNNVMYCTANNGDYYVWTNPQTGNNFVRVTTGFTSDITAITVPTQTVGVYTAWMAEGGKVYLVLNANTTTPLIQNRSYGLPSGYINCIAVDPIDYRHLVVVYTNYGVNSVWRTIDGGMSWRSIEGNLPDMPIRWALFRPKTNGNANQVFLATELGVWSTDLLNDSYTNWGPTNSGLANVRVDMLKYRSSDGVIAAATHGRGLYTSSPVLPNFTSTSNNMSVSTENNPTAVSNIKISFEASVCPNPVINELRVQATTYPVQVRVFNTKGESVLNTTINDSNDAIGMQDLIMGMYVIELIADSQKVVKLVLKQ